MAVANSASLLQQGITIAQSGARESAQIYLRRAAEESPRDPKVWLWLAWLADSPADTVQCLEYLLAQHPDHPLAQDGLRWARGLTGDATGPDFSELDETDFKWTSIAAASPEAGEGQSHTVGISAIENLGLAIAAVEELVLDTSPPRCYEDACDEFSSRPTAAPAPPSPPPTDSSLPEPRLATPELFEADDSWTDSTEPLTSESPTSPLVNAVAKHPESQFAADADAQSDAVVDVPVDAVEEAPVVQLPIPDAAGVLSYENELDNHSALLLSGLKQQISLLNSPTTAAGRQQTLLTARTILADTLEFLQKTERDELLLRNHDEICRVHGEIKKVDQLLEWPSLLGMLGLRKSSQQTPEQAYAEVGAIYAALLDSLLTQIAATFPSRSQAAQWEASFRPLLSDLKQLW